MLRVGHIRRRRIASRHLSQPYKYSYTFGTIPSFKFKGYDLSPRAGTPGSSAAEADLPLHNIIADRLTDGVALDELETTRTACESSLRWNYLLVTWK